VSNSHYLADRLRAHARLYRHIAEETWSEDRAQELARLADECTQAADAIAAGGGASGAADRSINAGGAGQDAAQLAQAGDESDAAHRVRGTRSIDKI
jgi:hypothetical protein